MFDIWCMVNNIILFVYKMKEFILISISFVITTTFNNIISYINFNCIIG